MWDDKMDTKPRHLLGNGGQTATTFHSYKNTDVQIRAITSVTNASALHSTTYISEEIREEQNYEFLRSLTSYNPIGLHGLLPG
jgi:hypothetical protein